MIGFAPEEIDQNAPTRAARLKWVVVVDASLAPGRAANAAICTAAATSRAVAGLLGDDAVDADGAAHPGLPWLGCTVLSADAGTLRTIRRKAAARPDFFVADMPAAAQHTRVYAEYLAVVKEAATESLDYYAVSIVGPRNPLDKIVGKLPLLG
ncbi:DUF2000 domain-containing protein [Actinoplanes sp. NPDC049596]|uniref:DUF2000 domain-containing protein n=1 Tax=unclassified Actinoplanes TaxID=2626549 RepID=UPI0034457760